MHLRKFLDLSVTQKYSHVTTYSTAASSVWHASVDPYSIDDSVAEGSIALKLNPYNIPIIPSLGSWAQKRELVGEVRQIYIQR